MTIEGKVTGVVLRNGKKFAIIEVPDARFPTVPNQDQIYIAAEDFELGDFVTLDIHKKEAV